MSGDTERPGCYGSMRGPVQDAERCCHDCSHDEACAALGDRRNKFKLYEHAKQMILAGKLNLDANTMEVELSEDQRQEWETCVADSHADRTGMTWCGAKARGFVFLDVDHAAQNGRAGGRLTVCPKCLEAIKRALCV